MPGKNNNLSLVHCIFNSLIKKKRHERYTECNCISGDGRQRCLFLQMKILCSAGTELNECRKIYFQFSNLISSI